MSEREARAALSYEVRAGRMAGRLYAVATVATPVWAVLTGVPLDNRMIVFIAACATAAAVPHLPVWNAHGPHLAVGEIPLWVRRQLDAANRAMVQAEGERAERASDQLAQRGQLAGSLRALVSDVTASSQTVEAQAASIAESVQQLASSSYEIAGTAGAAESAVRQIAGATDESRDLIAQLGAAGEEIVGIVARSPTWPARPTCWPSTPPSSPHGRGRRARGSPWWPAR